ncbi:MAG: ribosome maturation factor RimM [Clostridia bacterium]|nr:ribosome maturation factor RimM [Clostridia bacterium]
MRKEFLEVGKVVGTHGVKGAMRLQPWSDDSAFLEKIKTVYLADKTPIKLVSAKAHGNITVITAEGIDSIEKAEALRNKVLMIKRNDADIGKDRYFIDEIISSQVFDADTGALLGILSDVSKTGANDVWHIKRNEKEYLIPAIESVVVSVDIDAEKVIIRPLGGIFDED